MLRESQEVIVDGIDVIKSVKPAAWGAFAVSLSRELNVGCARSPRDILRPDMIWIETPERTGATIRETKGGGEVRSDLR